QPEGGEEPPGPSRDVHRSGREPLSPGRGRDGARRVDSRGADALADIQELRGRAGGEQVQDAGDDARPPRLVAGAETSPVVAVQVLVEEQVVPPVRVLLELPGSPVDGPATLGVTEEDAGQAAPDLLGDLVQGHLPAGAGGALDGERVAVVGVVLDEG